MRFRHVLGQPAEQIRAFSGLSRPTKAMARGSPRGASGGTATKFSIRRAFPGNWLRIASLTAIGWHNRAMARSSAK
jgi:hypothetical protein